MKKLLIAIFAAFTLAQSVVSVAASPKAEFEHSTVRLFQAGFDGEVWQVGLEILLPGEWKTYWRVPGDAGVPPEFNWAESRNLTSVDISWPAPARYRDNAGESIGYKHHVVFPLSVEPADSTQPVHLKLNLFYAVCDDICVPAQAKVDLELSFSSANPSDIALLQRFIAQVPRRKHPELAIHSASVQMSDGKPVLSIVVKGIAAPDEADIYVVGMNSAYFRQPVIVDNNVDTTRYGLHVDGIKTPEELRGKQLDIVVTYGKKALAQKIVIE
jgi:DsbC/DsbD-like thiol-disulfide interchange protein